MSGGLQRIRQWPHDLLSGGQSGQVLHIIVECIARHGHAVAMKDAFFKQHLENRRNSAHAVQIFHNVEPAWLEVRK